MYELDVTIDGRHVQYFKSKLFWMICTLSKMSSAFADGAEMYNANTARRPAERALA
jgi:hypothetical protein